METKEKQNSNREEYWNDISSMVVIKKGSEDEETSNKEAALQYIKSLLKTK